MRGKVKWYKPEKHYGFILRDTGEDDFVHQSALPPGIEYLLADQPVEYDLAPNNKDGKLNAVNLKV